MDLMSILVINNINIYDIKDHFSEKYGLIIRSISSSDRSFERALSVCLFGNEDEVDSISYTLSSQRDRLFSNKVEEYESYVLLAAEIYGITISIHKNSSEYIYQFEEKCPIVHLIKIKLNDDSEIYLPTERVANNNDCSKEEEEEEGDHDEEYKESKSGSANEIEHIWSSDVTIRQMQGDGNCYFRALSDQLSHSQEGHLILRIIIIDFISENRTKFESSVDREHFSSWEDFIDRMRQHGTFADGIVVAASALMLRKNIIIHDQTRRPVLFKGLFLGDNHFQIHLNYNSKNLHYDSIWLNDGDRLHIEESDCISV